MRYSVQLSPARSAIWARWTSPCSVVWGRIDALAREPEAGGCTKLKAGQRWRIRVGDYRILYTIEDRRLVVLVIKIGHRREVYR